MLLSLVRLQLGRLAALVFPFALASSPALAQPRFDLVENQNGKISNIRSLSYDGHSAAGFGGNVGFRWTRDGGRENFGSPLEFSGGEGISSDGRVVVGSGGFIGATTQQAFRRLDNGTIQGLGFLSGYSATAGTASNRDGSVLVGSAFIAGQTTIEEPFRWTAATGMKKLTGSPGGYGQARDISGDGSTVVGTINPGSILNPQKSFVWTQATGFTYLHDGVGMEDGVFVTNISADARWICGSGLATIDSVVVGSALLWDNGVPQALGVLPGYLASGANGVSDDGSVAIGQLGKGNGKFDPFIWTKTGGMMLAIDYLRSNGVELPSDTLGITLNCVSGDGLTFGGQIAADSLPNGGGGFVASIPSPAAFTALALSGLTALGRRSRG